MWLCELGCGDFGAAMMVRAVMVMSVALKRKSLTLIDESLRNIHYCYFCAKENLNPNTPHFSLFTKT
jgi:hypothetical protein